MTGADELEIVWPSGIGDILSLCADQCVHPARLG